MRTPMVCLLGDLGRQAVRFGPEQPRRRLREQLVGLVEARLAVHRGGQHLQPGARSAVTAAPASGAATTGIEKMLPADARRHLPLYGSTLCPPRITAAGAHGVGDANQRARIARLADLDGDRDQPRRAGQHIRQPGRRHFAHRHQPRRSDGVGQRFCGPLGHQMDRTLLGGQQRRVPLRRELGDEHLADQSARRRGLDQVGAFGEESSRPPPADVAMQFDRRGHPGRAFGEHRKPAAKRPLRRER